MRKKRFIRLVVVLLAILGVVELAHLWKSCRPWYGLTPLGYWLDRYGESPGDYKPCPQADEALRRVGTNAVPHLLRLLHSTNSIATAKALAAQAANPYASMMNPPSISLKDRLKMWVEKLTPIRFKRPTVYLGGSSGPRIRAHPHPVPASWNHWHAYLGFQVLGPLGRAAIPDLVKLAHDPAPSGNYPNIRQMKDIASAANQADNSSSYVAPGDSPSAGGKVLRNNPFLVDGEIAAWSLAAIGGESVPPLLELLADPNPRLRARAAEALGMIGESAEPAVPAIVIALNDPDMEVRMRAADALGCIGRRADLAIPALTKALSDRQEGVDYYAAQSLGDFGQRATSAIPALLTNFASGDYRNKDSAALALSKISPVTTEVEVIPVLVRDLQGSRNGSGNMSLITLGQMTNEADLVIPAIIGATDDANQMVRGNAAGILGGFGPAAKAAVPKLVRLTNDPDIWVRDRAVGALKKIAPAR